MSTCPEGNRDWLPTYPDSQGGWSQRDDEGACLKVEERTSVNRGERRQGAGRKKEGRREEEEPSPRPRPAARWLAGPASARRPPSSHAPPSPRGWRRESTVKSPRAALGKMGTGSSS